MDRRAWTREGKLLVVEDNFDLAQLLEFELNDLGVDTTVAATGEAALEVAQRDTLAAAVVDLGLPDWDGFALGEELARCLPQMLLVALSGFQPPDHIRPFHSYLQKPVLGPAILEEIDAVYARLRG